MTLKYVRLLRITIALFHCLLIRESHIISTRTVRSLCLRNSLLNNVTASRSIYVHRRLLFNVNGIPYLQGHA